MSAESLNSAISCAPAYAILKAHEYSCHAARANRRLGWWGDFFNDIGAHVHYIRAFEGEAVPHDANEYSAVVSLGGPMNVDEEAEHAWLHDENILIQHCLRQGTPFMGLCLGAQLLAKAAGARVVRSPQPEIGWLDVELNNAGKECALFQGLPPTFKVLQWHGDMFRDSAGRRQFSAVGSVSASSVASGRSAPGACSFISKSRRRNWMCGRTATTGFKRCRMRKAAKKCVIPRASWNT
jgi:GMP synthase-like glutamine amidotransferase